MTLSVRQQGSQTLQGRLPNALPFDSRNMEAQVYTPREFVSGFIEPPRGAAPLESAWHAAAVALETERVRIVHREADGGIYFLAADAADFVIHPNAMTPLAAALPGAAGHKGNGAYFIDLAAGIVAVVIKEPKILRCYMGERNEAMRFAEGKAHFWPNECELWVGFRQLESQNTRRLAKLMVAAGMALAAIFFAFSVFASWKSETLLHQRSAALNGIHTEQKKMIAELSAAPADAFMDYRKLAATIVALGGKLVRFESTGDRNTFEAEFPAWASDLSALGTGLKTRMENAHIIVSRGG